MTSDESSRELRVSIIGKFVRDARLRAGLTQQDIADRLGYTTAQFVSNWERGISTPPMDALEKLVKILNLCPVELAEVVHTYQIKMLDLHKRRVERVLGIGNQKLG